MAIIVLLISISLIIAVGFLISFLWNMKTGQYDDTYSPGVRMLFENEINNTTNNSNDNHAPSTSSTTEKV